MNLIKIITFTRKASFEVQAFYPDEEVGPDRTLAVYRVELPAELAEPRRVKLRLKLDINGVFTVDQAQMLEDAEEAAKEDAKANGVDHPPAPRVKRVDLQYSCAPGPAKVEAQAEA